MAPFYQQSGLVINGNSTTSLNITGNGATYSNGALSINGFNITNGTLTIDNPQILNVSGSGQTLTETAAPVTYVVQHAYGYANDPGTGGAGTVTLSNPVTPGNFLVACLVVSDTFNGPQAGFTNALPGNYVGSTIYYKTISGTGDNSFSWSGNRQSTCVLMEINTSSVDDSDFSNATVSYSAPNLDCSAITTVNNGLLIICYGDWNGSYEIAYSNPNVGTILAQGSTSGYNNPASICVVTVPGTGASVTPTIQVSANDSGANITAIYFNVPFKASANVQANLAIT
jgi:hypothetical protein